MRRLILLRHSKAERAEPGARDFDRTLTARGRVDAGQIGCFLARHRLLPDLALVSPARRTRETWDLSVAEMRPAPTMELADGIYDASVENLFDIVAGSQPQTLMLVGHNPGLQELAILLTATGDIDMRERLHEKFPTSGVAIIDFAFDAWSDLHPQSGRLERFLSPADLTGRAA